jgi:hypothetical protein
MLVMDIAIMGRRVGCHDASSEETDGRTLAQSAGLVPTPTETRLAIPATDEIDIDFIVYCFSEGKAPGRSFRVFAGGW